MELAKRDDLAANGVLDWRDSAGVERGQQFGCHAVGQLVVVDRMEDRSAHGTQTDLVNQAS